MRLEISAFAAFLIFTTFVSCEPRIQSLDVDSKVRSRFASTQITSKILNPDSSDKEVVFDVLLPNAAFISNFSMQIGDEIIIGDVNEKEKAQKAYDKAKSKGQTAGLIAQVPRETNRFRISVNVAAREKAIFNLTYQEILRRVQGTYKHQININPTQNVESMNVKVFIVEKPKISVVKVPAIGAKTGDKTNKKLLDGKSDKSVQIKQETKDDLNTATITWTPSSSDLKNLGKTGAQMVVLYDVERSKDGGEIETVNGYFVHHFAPAGLPVGSKHVVFVLDRSGSMSGTKVQQMKEAMELILDDLDESDKVSIVTFSTDVSVWKPKPILASDANKRNAKKFIKSIDASGGTNIHDALEKGITFMNINKEDGILSSMVIFLTDGRPTEGKTSSEEILGGVNKWNKAERNSVHCVSFGNDADFDLLQKISVQNEGLARKVYEDSDAELQLTGFFDEISSPLLSDVDVKYLDETVNVSSLIKDKSAVLSKGSEVVVIGQVNGKKFSKDAPEMVVKSEIKAKGASGVTGFTASCIVPCWHWCYPRPMPRCHAPVPYLSDEGSARPRIGCVLSPHRPTCDFPCPPPPPPKPEYDPLPPTSIGGFIERMWAYLTIKKVLEESKYASSSQSEKKRLKQKALDMSLKYNFVTELTSMVVVKPGEDTAAELDLEDEKASSSGSGRLMGSFGGRGPSPSSFSSFAGSGATAGGAFGGGASGAGGFSSLAGFKGGPLPGAPGPAGWPHPSRPRPIPLDRVDLSSSGEETKKLSWKTAEESAFDINWDTESRSASSTEQCARLCKRSNQCTVALFTPAMNNCLMAKPADFTCSKPESKITDGSPVVIFCFQ